VAWLCKQNVMTINMFTMLRVSSFDSLSEKWLNEKLNQQRRQRRRKGHTIAPPYSSRRAASNWSKRSCLIDKEYSGPCRQYPLVSGQGPWWPFCSKFYPLNFTVFILVYSFKIAFF
jgi:hypothetical protein